MSQLNGKSIIVTGGSRGFGRGIVEAFVAEGATVWTIARDAGRLDQLKREVKGVQTLSADVADPQVASQSLREIHPTILVLNAGAAPTMLPVQEQSWEQFSQVWETDVKAAFYFGKQALLMPMTPGSVVMIVSSGAALVGSQLAGGYAGAKRMLWFLAQYLQEESNRLNLGIRFMTLLPRLTSATDLGHASAAIYAAQQGITEQAYLARFGTLLTPAIMGHAVVTLLTDTAYQNGIAFSITGQGIEKLN